MSNRIHPGLGVRTLCVRRCSAVGGAARRRQQTQRARPECPERELLGWRLRAFAAWGLGRAGNRSGGASQPRLGHQAGRQHMPVTDTIQPGLHGQQSLNCPRLPKTV
eukprot:4338310-Alexandrium_andersonii.AAC.1